MLPALIADIACQNKAVVYDLLFKASAETMLTIAADVKHLGARIGVTSVLHPRERPFETGALLSTVGLGKSTALVRNRKLRI